MSGELFWKGVLALVYSGCVALVVMIRERDELGYTGRQRYLPYVNGVLLPAYILAVAAVSFLFYSVDEAMRLLFTIFFETFLQIAVYDVLLLCLLPYLRRVVSAKVCAALWLLPNYLYLTQMGIMRLREPKVVIRVPGKRLWILFAVWFAGFLLLLGFRVVSHLLFRRRILRDAQVVTDPEVLAVWEEELGSAKYRNLKVQLVTSSEISTPLTVGLFRRKMRVVLPVREYTPEELALILRHEIVHIGREDAWSKFFLAFCEATCWFNPMAWIAVRRSAEDMELSCDETVLCNADEDTKRRYADLLLRTAGEERGFTTCLSASASALRYRLKNVVDPSRKSRGAFLLGAVFFVLIMSSGYVALAYGGGSGREEIFGGGEPAAYSLRSFAVQIPSGGTIHEDWILYHGALANGADMDEEALFTYLAALELTELTGTYTHSGSSREYCLYFDTPEGPCSVVLYDQMVKIMRYRGGRRQSVRWFYLPDGADWEYLDTLISVRAEE